MLNDFTERTLLVGTSGTLAPEKDLPEYTLAKFLSFHVIFTQ